MKILIVSTPKTGNTWLRHLLSATFGLPMPPLPTSFDRLALEQLPDGWVAHEHWLPSAETLEWAAASGVKLLTTIRHPGDTLLSLAHYAHGKTAGDDLEPTLRHFMRERFDTMGKGLADYCRREFFNGLSISIAWLATGRSRAVRYEDLRRDTCRELTRIVQGICEGSELPEQVRRQIPRAVEASTLESLRKVTGLSAAFFRKGSLGDWKEDLGAEVIDVFRSQAPYPAQFRALGYSLDEDRPFEVVPQSDADPFRGALHFADGKRITPSIVRVFLTMDPLRAKTLEPLGATASAGSFASWLIAPADDDPKPGAEPLVTNLAMRLLGERDDLRRAFARIGDEDRVEFCIWFVREGPREHGFDPAFTRPVVESLRHWAASDPPTWNPPGEPLYVNRLAAEIWNRRDDLRATFPDVRGSDRSRYLLWLLLYGIGESRLDDDCLTNSRESFSRWAAIDPDGRPPTDDEYLPNLADLVWRMRPDLQEAFPSPRAGDRTGFLRWYHKDGYALCPEFREFSIGAPPDFFRWANEICEADVASTCRPRLTNLLACIYQRRPEVQARFPDVLGRDRLAYVEWILRTGRFEHVLTREYLAPLLIDWANAAEPSVAAHGVG